MHDWLILGIPLLVAALVLALGFVGCGLDVEGTGAPDLYQTSIFSNPHLVSYWRLDESAGATAAADDKGANAGTYVGGVTLSQPGLPQNGSDTAATFDGVSGYVKVPHKDGSLNPPKFTVEALVRLTGGNGAFRAVVSSRDIDAATKKHYGYILYANDQNKWEAWLGDGTTGAWQMVTGPPASSATMHYLAMTYDGTTLSLYVDPVDDAPQPGQVFSKAVGFAANGARELRIGAGANEQAPTYFFAGTIDEVAIYNDALDYKTIRSHSVVASVGMAPP